ncbi:MAG: hypothetical protein ACK5N8_04110 [Alphaproteobacteria bacterium]
MKKFSRLIFAMFIGTCFNAQNAFSQSSPTCESLGFTATTATCAAVGVIPLPCPMDSSKVYCNIKKTCEDGGYRTNLSEGVVGCTTVTYEGNSCYANCTSCKSTYDRYNIDYSKVVKSVSGTLCSPYIAWSSGQFLIKTDETCSEFKSRTITEVNNYNNSICGTQYKKITYTPSSMRCNDCCQNGNMMVCINEM